MTNLLCRVVRYNDIFYCILIVLDAISMYAMVSPYNTVQEIVVEIDLDLDCYKFTRKTSSVYTNSLYTVRAPEANHDILFLQLARAQYTVSASCMVLD